jgi:predicted component of type VI protein secretion system
MQGPAGPKGAGQPAQLVSLNDDGCNILLDKPILLIGRHPECDIQIDSRKVSRRHCCIAQVEDFLIVRDLGSTNGIRINGARVVEGRLKNGDEVTIGNNRFRVQWGEAPPPVAKAAEPKPAREAPPAPGAAVRKLATSREAAGPPVPLPDEMLEGCDDPVALPDDELDSPRPQAPAAQGRPPAAPPPAKGKRPEDDSEGGSLILPDNLELAHHSDVYPPPAPPAP